MKRITFYFLFVLSLAAGLQADRLMDPNETETLIRRLTQNSREYWLPQGMIQARHMQYYEYDDTIRETMETVYYNNIGFRLETRIEDGILTADVSVQNSPQQFQQDIQLNRDRIFVWNGQKYVQYFKSADYAIIETASAQEPTVFRGPATAGIIPWGHGDLSFLVIMSQNPTCRIVQQNEQEVVMLEYISDTISLETQISFVLDPALEYAVLSYTIENEQALLRQTYDDYLQTAEQWIPTKVLIERLDKRSGTPQLISYEDWQFETVDPAAPAEGVYSVAFKNGTMVELHAAEDLNTLLYHASDRIDITALLEDKITLLQTPDPQSVNCATVAIQHVAKQFSRNITFTDLADLVSQDTKKTSLLDMQQTLEDAGLQCMAIETNLETLQQMPGCTKILYMALSDHYVIFDHIEDNEIWLIDLTDRKFYAKWNVEQFLQEWSSGIALLVSDAPITPPLNTNFNYLEPAEAAQIYGGGGFGKYSCTDVIQEAQTVRCPNPIGGVICYGAYYVFEKRKGCIEDETGGVCIGDKMLSYTYNPCVNHPQTQGNCQRDNRTYSRYIRACQ